MTDPALHAHAVRELAQALRHYDNARRWRESQHYGPGHEEAAQAVRSAIVELCAAARRAVLTSDVEEGTETSPLMGGTDARR